MPNHPTTVIYRTRVRFVDTDASGRIHYTAMFRYFEAAETEFLRARGCSYDTIQTRTLGWPRVHVECDFTAEVGYDDLVDIAVAVERVGNTSFTLSYDASVDERPAAKGRITIVCMSQETHKAVPLPEDMRAALS